MKTILSFQPKRLRAELDALPPRSRAIFAALCARRLSHAYAGRHAPESAALRTFGALHEQLWRLTTSPPSSASTASEAATQALALAREEQDADALAEDAAAALVYALRVVQSGEAQDAVWAAERAYDAVYTFLQTAGLDSDSDDSEHTLLRHPLIQTELARQANDLRDLHGLETTRESRNVWDDLRDRADAAARGMFG